MDESKIIEKYNEGIHSVIIVVKDMSSRIDLLGGTIIGLNSEIGYLHRVIQEIKESSVKQALRIGELEARLNQNSSTSSKPPSQDGYKKTPKNSRQKQGRPSGGQPGHEGKTLEKVANPDETIEIKIKMVCDCGCNLETVDSCLKTRQVFDIPQPKILVTEYVTHSKVCPICGKKHQSEFPQGITQPTQYGSNMQALMNYLTNYQLIPLKRATEAIGDITGQSISEGTVLNSAKMLSEKVSGALESIKELLTHATVAHCDETGMRSEGKTKWLHVTSTQKLTYYKMHDKRGAEAVRDIGILPKFTGTAVHDHWKPYYCFKDCTHAECNAHNLRYLKDVVENHHQEWAGEMIGFLIEIHQLVKKLKADGCFAMPEEDIKMWQDRYHQIIQRGIVEDFEKSPQVLNKKGIPQKSKPLQLLYKLRDYDVETLSFMYDFDIPFDNNLAERDIRMQKLRQKISGGFRSAGGANVFCQIRSYLSTAKKNGINAMEAISAAIAGQPFVPQV